MTKLGELQTLGISEVPRGHGPLCRALDSLSIVTRNANVVFHFGPQSLPFSRSYGENIFHLLCTYYVAGIRPSPPHT